MFVCMYVLVGRNGAIEEGKEWGSETEEESCYAYFCKDYNL